MPARALRPYAAPPDSVRRERIEVQRATDPIRKLYKKCTWQHVSRIVRKRDPFCKIAKLCVRRRGLPAPSEVADHIIPAREYIEQHGGDLAFFFDLDNLQGACKADHDAKTVQECGFAAKWETAGD